MEKIGNVEDLPSVDEVILGVDTHLDLHVAVALDRLGRRLGETTVPTSTRGYAQRLLGGEASSEGLGGSAQPTFVHNLATLCVDEAQEVGAFVAEIHSGCHLRLFAATIHGGPIVLSILGVRARRTFADPPKGYCVGGRPSQLIFGERAF